MTHGYLQIKTRECRSEGCGGIPVNKHHIGAHLLQNGLQLKQDIARNVEKRLSGLHDGQIVIWHNLENPQHLLEHFTMLTRHTHRNVEFVRTRLQLVNERTHLDRLWACAKNEHYFFRHTKTLH